MAKSKEKVLIKCKGSTLLALKDLKPMQGNLKSLSDDSYTKLKSEILSDGFSFPFAVWRDKKNKHHILDGHQRWETLTRMEKEGYAVPKLPVALVQADNQDHAKKKLLAAASQYGVMSSEGLSEYLKSFKFDTDELLATIDIPRIDEFLKNEIADLPPMPPLESMQMPQSVVGEIGTNAPLAYNVVEMPTLKDTEEPQVKQMTFLLHTDQVADVERALKIAKKDADFDTTKNQNSNGNALHAIIEVYLEQFEK